MRARRAGTESGKRDALLALDAERGDNLVRDASVLRVDLDGRRQALGERDRERVVAVGDEVEPVVVVVLLVLARRLVRLGREEALEALLARAVDDERARDVGALADARLPQLVGPDADELDVAALLAARVGRLGLGRRVGCGRARGPGSAAALALARGEGAGRTVGGRRDRFDLFELDGEPSGADEAPGRGAHLDRAGEVSLRAQDVREREERVGCWCGLGRRVGRGDARVALEEVAMRRWAERAVEEGQSALVRGGGAGLVGGDAHARLLARHNAAVAVQAE